MSAKAEIADIQALVDRGFSSLDGGRFLLFRIIDASAAKIWLRTLPVASVAQARSIRLEAVCQIAFTASGLSALGLDLERTGGFSPEFVEGMTADERRSHRLGDIGANAPEHWDWGVGAEEPHILLMLLAKEAAIASFAKGILDAAKAAGCRLIPTPPCASHSGREPFGFADGISQPHIDWEGGLKPGGEKDRGYRDTLASGEVLLGHPNEYGFVTDYPRENEIGRNGTYLVYRQLKQDVRGFWRWLAASVDASNAIAMAERMVGRRIDGDPLPKLHPTTGGGRNAFDYSNDPHGEFCPIGAHIRRANPRTGDDPQGDQGPIRNLLSTLGLKGTAMEDAVAAARFHRILRRGRAYGEPLDPLDAMRADSAAAKESGLHFVCLNANIARQFEFVQGAWLASSTFGGRSGEQDPLLGNRLPIAGGRRTDAFQHWDGEGRPRLIDGLPQFVSVKGGAYFFAPGLKGLDRILSD